MERKLRNERFAAAAPLRMRTAADGIDRGIWGKFARRVVAKGVQV